MRASHVLCVLCVLCGQAVAVSVSTSPLPAQTPDTSALARARNAWARHPENADSIIWSGRRVGYTGAFDEAVAIYTEGLRIHPNDPRLLRHRGHRYLSLRNFPAAIADLTLARDVVNGRPDEVEPDGQPNARGIPTSTLHSNIRYHLALAHFVTGNFPQAVVAWDEDAKLAPNLDHRAAATYWWVLSLAQLHQWDAVQGALAPVRADWDILENHSYHRLLLWMKGEIADSLVLGDDATPLERQTVGNGMAHWYLARGLRAAAELKFREVLALGPAASFGYIAAEQTARRLGLRP